MRVWIVSLSSNSRFLWFASVHCDWLAKFAPPFQPMRSKTKTNRDLLASVFPRLAPLTRGSNSRFLWDSFTTLSDWSAKFAPPSQPMRSKTKTNRDLLTSVFPRLALVTCRVIHVFCGIALLRSVIGQQNSRHLLNQ